MPSDSKSYWKATMPLVVLNVNTTKLCYKKDGQGFPLASTTMNINTHPATTAYIVDPQKQRFHTKTA